jgi:hypothetical protein
MDSQNKSTLKQLILPPEWETQSWQEEQAEEYSRRSQRNSGSFAFEYEAEIGIQAGISSQMNEQRHDPLDPYHSSSVQLSPTLTVH